MLTVPTAPAALLPLLLDLVADCGELLALGLVDRVLLVGTDVLLVGGDHQHVEAVDLVELLGLGVGGAGHAAQLGVEAEVVLEGDRRQRLFSFSILTFSFASTAWCRPSTSAVQASGGR